MTLQDHHRTRIRAAMERRGLTCKTVARMARVHERTVQRFVEGETFDLRTLAKLEGALRLGPVGGGVTTDSDVVIRRQVSPPPGAGPVTGWRQAAMALGIHRATLWAIRRNCGQEKRWPWWKSPDAVRDWFDAMIAKGGT